MAAPVPAPGELHRLLSRVGRAVARPRGSAGPGPSAAARAVLVFVDAHGPVAHRDLAVALGVAPATVTAVVDRLERAGDVVRARDERDRRVVRVALTAQGRSRLAAAPVTDDGLPEPPPAEAEIVRRYLVSVLAALEDDRTGPVPRSAHPSVVRARRDVRGQVEGARRRPDVAGD